MAKTKISEYSSTANSNTDIASINIDEGCAPSGINNAIRALMAQLKDFQTGAAGDPVTVGDVLTVKGASINDTNGNELFKLTATASAVNELTIANAATGGSPTISATGGDTNIGINLTPKGTGNVSVSSGNLSFATTGQRITGDFSNATATNKVAFQSSTTNGVSDIPIIPNGTATIARHFYYNTSDIANAATVVAIGATSTEGTFRVSGIGTSPVSLPMTFYTGGSERMRIDTSGSLLVGQTGKQISGSTICEMTGVLGIGVRSTGGSGSVAGFFWNNATSGDNTFLQFATEAGGTIRGSVTYNRGGGLTAYNTTSDYRAKTVNGPVQNALSKVAALKPSTGRMNGAEFDIDFFIAHQLQEVVPSAVTGEKDAVNEDGTPKYQMVDKSALIPLLTAAIQELKAELDAAKADIAALKGTA